MQATWSSAPRPSLPSAAVAWGFLGCGAAVAALYAFAPIALSPALLVVPLASVVAVVVGARRNQAPTQRRPWYAMAGAQACFLGAAILRLVIPGVTANPPGPQAFIPDVLTVPGYLLFGYGLLEMLRRRRGTDDRSARTDAILIGLASALAMWVFILAPAVGSAGAVPWPRLAVASFPIIDVFLVTLVTRLMFADGVRQPAQWLLATTTAAMLTVDLIYVLHEQGDTSTAMLLTFDLLFMLAFLTMGAAALHPTMRTMTEPQQVVTRAVGGTRIVGIAAVLVAPTVLAYAAPAPNAWNVLVRVVLTGFLAVTVVARIVRSHDSQARAEQEALHRSTHDALTELPNRELLSDTIRQWSARATAEGQEISLLFLDLDRFKQVNDTWGHRVGDELLVSVAGRLGAMVRSTDLVCRIGGDEFVIALASPSHSELAQSLAERVVREFATPFTLSTGDVVITPSVGVVQAIGPVEPLELIRDADIAMYQAKDSGGNTYANFDTSLRDKTAARVALEQALRGALGRGELSVHYQPIVDLRGDELNGFEALMRWSHPQLGVVSPLQFIPIAEETGLIIASGEWLLNEALDQLARWRRDRAADLPDLHVSVNVSTRQLRDDALVGVVRHALERTGLPASALWLEITESVMIEDSGVALSALRALNEFGVTLCIDDFGTGYASLSYVRQLPAEIVKVDRSFTRGIAQEAGDEAIVLSVIAMAHALGQQVVAEGVETVEQRDWLRDHGCDLVQGYLYGAPRPAAAQLAWLDRALRPNELTQATTRV